MTRWLVTTAILAAMAIPAAAATAQTKPAKKEPPKPALKGEYAIMAKVCQLTPEQQDKLREAIAAAEADAKAQEAEHKKKLDEATKALADVRAQKVDRAKIVSSKVEEVLTPEQKATYAGYRLYVATCAKYAKLQLTKEQKADLEKACLPLGAGADGAAKADAKALELLTDAQKKKLEELNKPKGKPTSKPASRPANQG